MKKTTSGMGAVVVGLAMLTLSAVSAPAAERPGFETYVVRSGDTLSKISGRVFGDVKRWREILKENPQVTNANRIFPGDTLLVPVPETAAPAGGTAGIWRPARAPSRDARRGLRAPCAREIAAAPAATGDRRRRLGRRLGPVPPARRGGTGAGAGGRRRRGARVAGGRCVRSPSSTPRSTAPPATSRTGCPRSRSSPRRTIGSCSAPTTRPSSTPRSPPARASRWSAPTVASSTR